jgi:hypothetical protein
MAGCIGGNKKYEMNGKKYEAKQASMQPKKQTPKG